ncbi:DUF4129 domain-containing protein [Haloechinothrix halophila]|uniref:DUF4129 domain-containing protein n=1 Tax=Haloechinothrix halophila TaxID=1069073 RepID=UPI0006853269|nr:DUF4129 domain-containing protein [Haloechinothrix halophila]
MPSRARVVLFVLLLITAVAALRAPAPGAPMPAADNTPATVVIGWLIVLLAPALLVVLYAGLRYRPAPVHRPRRPRPARPRGRAALLALAALLAVTAALAALARVLPPARPTMRGGTDPDGTQETSPPAPAPPSEPDGASSAPELAATAVAVALLLLLAVAVLRARRPAPHDLPMPGTPAPSGARQQPLATAAGRALSAVETPGSDPRAAIISCYAAMERALAEAPASAPRPADAPADVLRRAAEQGQLSASTGSRMLELFHEARYSTHSMTEADRSAAATTLRTILAELGRPRWRSS